MNKHKILLLFVFLLTLSACKTQQKPDEINYMQNAEQLATDTSLRTSVSTIQTGDQLVILVTAKDMSVVKPFNQNYFSGDIVQLSQPSSNVGLQGQEKVSGPTYIVDAEGMIDFPVLGQLDTKNKSLVQFKEELRNRLLAYVLNPTVNMRITNYKVTVLGEVNSPGQYVIPDSQATVLNALGLAKDLTIYGKRDDILIVRNVDGQISKERINLMDANFINSPYYQLQQGDVIYVSANDTRKKEARLDPNTSTYIAIAGTVIGLAGIFITIFKK